MNNKRVIYTSYQPYTLELAKQLHKDLGWEPVFWNVIDGFEQHVKEVFPKVLTHNYSDAIKGKPTVNFVEDELESIDSKILDSLSKTESIALNMMNRNYLDHSFEYQERLRLFHRQVRFYFTLIKKLKPDCLILEDTPHETCDYVLYILAQKMGVKTILCEGNIYANYFFPMQKFEEGNLNLRKEYSEACDNLVESEYILSIDIINELSQLKAKFNIGVQTYMAQKSKDFKKHNQHKLFNQIKSWIFMFFKLFNILKFKKRFVFVMNIFTPAHHNYYKQKGKNIEDSFITNFENLLDVMKKKRIKKRNMSY